MSRRPTAALPVYRQDMALLNTPAEAGLDGRARDRRGVVLPFMLTDDLLVVLATGLRRVDRRDRAEHRHRVRGQVSLGHAFFLGDRRLHRGGDVR